MDNLEHIARQINLLKQDLAHLTREQAEERLATAVNESLGSYEFRTTQERADFGRFVRSQVQPDGRGSFKTEDGLSLNELVAKEYSGQKRFHPTPQSSPTVEQPAPAGSGFDLERIRIGMSADERAAALKAIRANLP